MQLDKIMEPYETTSNNTYFEPKNQTFMVD